MTEKQQTTKGTAGKARKVLPSARQEHPDRQTMVSTAIHMERSGFTFEEWSTVDRICCTSADARYFILDYAKDFLDMLDGLKPHKGERLSEIAVIAADHALLRACKKIENSRSKFRELTTPPEQWTEEQYAKARSDYIQRSPDRTGVTDKLLNALEREAHTVYKVPYVTPDGCKIIPFVSRVEAKKVSAR